jgi:hypothetical protein
MTDAGHAGHGGQPGQPYFPAAEWESFQAADRQAARNIIVLMGGIFSIGLLLYATVCWLVHVNW